MERFDLAAFTLIVIVLGLFISLIVFTVKKIKRK
jgi:hypothetical protein